MNVAQLKMAAPPLETGAVCLYPWDPLLARRFTIPSKYDDDTPAQLWRRVETSTGPLIALPRQCCPPSPNDQRSTGTAIALTFTGTPRDAEQDRVIKEMIKLLLAGESFVVQAPTGSGKTVCAIAAACALGVTTLVIATKDDLVDQWMDRIVQYTGIPRSAIGRIQGDECNVQGRPIVVASLRSVFKDKRYPAWVYRYFGLMIFDEVHNAGADLMSDALTLFYAKQRIGLSATPHRKDGKDIIYEAHIGPVRVKSTVLQLKAKVLLLTTNWTCPRNKMGERPAISGGRIQPLLKSMFNHGGRNVQICKTLQAAHEMGRQVVAFSEYTSHLELLETSMPAYGVHPQDMGRYYGVTTKEQLATAAKKRLLWATPGKMKEGTDIPTLDACALLSPRADVEQIVGRILRLLDGKKAPVVFDFIDLDHPVLKNYAKARMQFYERSGFTIKHAALDAEAA